ncbi:MAG: DMP19 family protein [Prevotella sp.]|nr:DMP19 family protein [Prevotella sp.]
MTDIKINDSTLQQAAGKGMDEFVKAVTDAIYAHIGGKLNTETMAMLNADQITLLAWNVLHDEVMDGGFIQLIHNGYGAFIFRNPFGKAMRGWGIDEVATLINRARKLYDKYRQTIERDCTDEEFMAMFEQMPEFDACDDSFVEHEEQWTAAVAYYADEHLDHFVTIVKD